MIHSSFQAHLDVLLRVLEVVKQGILTPNNPGLLVGRGVRVAISESALTTEEAVKIRPLLVRATFFHSVTLAALRLEDLCALLFAHGDRSSVVVFGEPLLANDERTACLLVGRRRNFDGGRGGIARPLPPFGFSQFLPTTRHSRCVTFRRHHSSEREARGTGFTAVQTRKTLTLESPTVCSRSVRNMEQICGTIKFMKAILPAPDHQTKMGL